MNVTAEYWQKCITHAEKEMSEWWDVQKQYDFVQTPIVISLGQSSSGTEISDNECSD